MGCKYQFKIFSVKNCKTGCKISVQKMCSAFIWLNEKQNSSVDSTPDGSNKLCVAKEAKRNKLMKTYSLSESLRKKIFNETNRIQIILKKKQFEANNLKQSYFGVIGKLKHPSSQLKIQIYVANWKQHYGQMNGQKRSIKVEEEMLRHSHCSLTKLRVCLLSFNYFVQKSNIKI